MEEEHVSAFFCFIFFYLGKNLHIQFCRVSIGSDFLFTYIETQLRVKYLFGDILHLFVFCLYILFYIVFIEFNELLSINA